MKNIIKKGGILLLLLSVALFMNIRLGYITLISCFCFLVFVQSFWSTTKMDRAGWMILLFCVLYVIFSAINGIDYTLSTLVLWLIAPPIFYYYGKRMTDLCETENDLLYFWFIILLCYALDVAIAGVSDIYSTGSFIANSRSLSVFEEQEFSATQLGLRLNIAMVGLPIAVLVSDKRLKLLYTLLTCLSVLVVIYLMNRTGLVILFLCLSTIVIMRSCYDRRFAIIALLVIFAGVYLLRSSDFYDWTVTQMYKARNEQEGLETRYSRWIEHVGYLFEYPFSWAKRGEVYYVHNMWLDIARISGIIPFLMLVGLTVNFFVKAIKDALKYKMVQHYFILGLTICFFASCFVEPILGGTHFMLYCLLWGCQSSLCKKTLLI
jgi:hypothetical protein